MNPDLPDYLITVIIFKSSSTCGIYLL